MNLGETIFALSSGRPPAAVSIIRISGPRAHAAGQIIAGSLPLARTAAVRELRDPATGELLDQGLVLRFDGPTSSTGEDVVEFQCHGGRAIIDAVLGALTSVTGLRSAEPGEFTRRAFENGRIDLTEAEGLADLIEAETQSQRKAALALAEGGFKKQIAAWETQLVGLSAQVERAIDYDESDDVSDLTLQSHCAALASEFRSWLEQPRMERLKNGVRAIVAGPPNSGKSSLINAIAGEDRAIVTEVPGTTRDHIEVPLSLGGVPILLTDTAGLRDSTDKVEAIGVARALTLIGSADILVWLGEARKVPDHPRTIFVHAKADLPDRAIGPDSSIALSSLTGEGVARLLGTIEEFARGLLPGEDVIALNRRQAKHIEEAADAVAEAARTSDPLLLAENLRVARLAFERLTGRAGIEEVLDALFSRFCLGK